ncbi:hypothetical protein P168DRAFT_300508 [Aspergillus campestris IBT 28561]|uniref:Alpha/beta-hydrolase n=1 Tax=Aspergillus campestris (strain IBT 28561) TaxID=1392248 RepID=A0A2I1CQ09_ASPC2|nr:uncharacterized protein P168DRAFT_300508 [Aspergillus campestris IBT 28561]PKX99703.1 hypothetical protein P168DRAFT_300508 [Aspergillus campestris IBT 28561]
MAATQTIRPTCVLINSMCMTTALYRPQFESAELTAAVNLLAIEPLGHGATSCATEHFTYWDSAIMALQVLDALNIKKRVIPLGTSMDSESPDSRSKGCWDPAPLLAPFHDKWSGIGFGANSPAETGEFWTKTLKEVYRGDEGRKKVRMAVNCLLERDGLLMRLRDVKCPVYWLQAIRLLSGSVEASLRMVEGGAHYLNATNPAEVNQAVLEMVRKYA